MNSPKDKVEIHSLGFSPKSAVANLELKYKVSLPAMENMDQNIRNIQDMNVYQITVYKDETEHSELIDDTRM